MSSSPSIDPIRSPLRMSVYRGIPARTDFQRRCWSRSLAVDASRPCPVPSRPSWWYNDSERWYDGRRTPRAVSTMGGSLFMTTASLILLLSLLGAAQPAQAHEGEWKLVWHDEFDKEGQPDPASWDHERGFVRINELQWYQPENAI